MPRLEQVLRAEDFQRGRAVVRIDLTPYLRLIDSILEQGGVGAVLSLEEGEQQRTQKRRLSLAAKERSYRLVWRTAPPGQLRFVLARPGEPAPGGRRRTAAERRAERTTLQAVMAEGVANATGRATVEGESVEAPARAARRRRR